MGAYENTQIESDVQSNKGKLYLKFLDSFFAAATVIVVLTYLTDFLPNSFYDYIWTSPVLSFFYSDTYWLFGLLFGLGYMPASLLIVVALVVEHS